tara:strand:- start:306 stop:716 length:411 start_codon:yes stop_codon:yes gene_type:complete
MNDKQRNKINARIEEIEKFLNDNRDYSKFDSHALFIERNELEFKRNTENVNISLRTDSKYYLAAQCFKFTKNLLKYGYDKYTTKEEIEKEGVCFNKYSINVGYSQYCKDLKRFNSKEEMFGFVIGYNEAVNNSKAI